MQGKSYNLLDQQKLVDDILADTNTTSFFLLNTTDRPSVGGKSTDDAATMLLTVSSQGQSRMIRIPVSWVPVDAALLATKKEIAESADFRRAYSTRRIMVISHTDAHRIINDDEDSQAEYARVMALAQGINGSEDAYQSGRETSTPVNDPWANVSQEVKLSVEEVTGETMSLGEFKSWMRRNERAISALDREYVADKVPEYSA